MLSSDLKLESSWAGGEREGTGIEIMLRSNKLLMSEIIFNHMTTYTWCR